MSMNKKKVKVFKLEEFECNEANVKTMEDAMEAVSSGHLVFARGEVEQNYKFGKNTMRIKTARIREILKSKSGYKLNTSSICYKVSNAFV